MVEGAIVVALAEVLSLIPTDITIFFSISLDMIPLLLFTYRRGMKKGILFGLLYGIFKIIIGDIWALSAIQVAIEYTLPYASVGFAGLFSHYFKQALKRKDKSHLAIRYLILGTTISIFIRYFWHFIAGVWFWGAYAPQGVDPVTYSVLVNGGHMIGTIIGVLLVLIFLYKRSITIFLP